MLIRTDPSRHRVAYLSIPRDLRVPIEGVGDTKINAAMQSGGAPLAIKTVRNYTGLPVNHVITVDFTQFKDVIDALGGITVDVPERIVSKFDCPLKTNAECDSLAGLALREGPQHMSGKRALIYSRVRKNLLNPADTDISRTEHQQDVLRATLSKMTSVSTLGKLPFIGSDLVKPLATDLSTFQFLQIGWVYKRGHELHCRLGGTPETLPDGESVIVAEGDDKERVILGDARQDGAAAAAARRGTLRRRLRHGALPALTKLAAGASRPPRPSSRPLFLLVVLSCRPSPTSRSRRPSTSRSCACRPRP